MVYAGEYLNIQSKQNDLFLGTNIWHSDVPTNVPSLSTSSPPSKDLVCIDNAEYVSPVNPKFGCELYNGTDCSIWQAFLNDEQMKDMFKQCSDSCKRW